MTFIAFEGCDASGKSTQSAILAERIGAVVTREPGGTPAGARIRSLVLDHSPEGASLGLRAEALLMAADRAQDVEENIEPALRSGRVVIADRYIDSSLAYQGYGRGLAVAELRALSAWATNGRWPDCSLLIRVPIEIVVARIRAGGRPDRLESEGPEFLQRVIDGFDTLAASEPSRWRVVDGVGTIDEVADRVRVAVADFV